jgi:hypothetical protein
MKLLQFFLALTLVRSIIGGVGNVNVCKCFVTEFRFHSEELLAPRPTPKLEYHPLSAARD